MPTPTVPLPFSFPAATATTAISSEAWEMILGRQPEGGKTRGFPQTQDWKISTFQNQTKMSPDVNPLPLITAQGPKCAQVLITATPGVPQTEAI